MIERERAMILIFIGVIIILIVIIATPFIYKSYKETFTPPNKPKLEDHDGDGLPDNIDPDDDNDGIPDAEDLVPYADAGIKVYITGFRIKTPLSLRNSTASVYAKIFIDGELAATLPNTPYTVEVDKDYAVNWSTPIINVDDGIGEHTIKIELYGNKKLLDINGENASKKDGEKILIVNYYIGNEVGHEERFSGDGSNDGNNKKWAFIPLRLKILFMEKDAFIQGEIVTVNAG